MNTLDLLKDPGSPQPIPEKVFLTEAKTEIMIPV